MSSHSQTYNTRHPLEDNSQVAGGIEEMTALIAVGAFSVLALGIYVATFATVLRG